MFENLLSALGLPPLPPGAPTSPASQSAETDTTLDQAHPLSNAPRVLLAEVYADLRDAAVARTVMADWEQKVAKR